MNLTGLNPVFHVQKRMMNISKSCGKSTGAQYVVKKGVFG
jgi:hypothetical protein